MGIQFQQEEVNAGNGEFAPIAPGDYNVQVVKDEEAITKTGKGHFKFQLKILDEGPFKNRIIFHSLWFEGPTAVMFQNLMVKCFNINIANGENLESYSFRNAIGKVKVEDYTYTGRDGEVKGTRIKRYILPTTQATAPVQQAAPAQQAQFPTTNAPEDNVPF